MKWSQRMSNELRAKSASSWTLAWAELGNTNDLTRKQYCDERILPLGLQSGIQHYNVRQGTGYFMINVANVLFFNLSVANDELFSNSSNYLCHINNPKWKCWKLAIAAWYSSDSKFESNLTWYHSFQHC